MSCIAIAHDAHYDKLILRQWHYTSGQKTIVGSFYMFKDNKVFIEDINGEILSIPLSKVSDIDKAYVMEKYQNIVEINTNHKESYSLSLPIIILTIVSLLFLTIFIFYFSSVQQRKFLYPVLFVGILGTLFSFTQRLMKTTTDPNFINSAFIPFKPDVNTRWDNNYFSVS